MKRCEEQDSGQLGVPQRRMFYSVLSSLYAQRTAVRVTFGCNAPSVAGLFDLLGEFALPPQTLS